VSADRLSNTVCDVAPGVCLSKVVQDTNTLLL